MESSHLVIFSTSGKFITKFNVLRCISLKCIWNEIFDNNFIVLLESVLKDKINAVYRLLITFLDPKLWRSEVLKIRWKNGKKSSKNQ